MYWESGVSSPRITKQPCLLPTVAPKTSLNGGRRSQELDLHNVVILIPLEKKTRAVIIYQVPVERLKVLIIAMAVGVEILLFSYVCCSSELTVPRQIFAITYSQCKGENLISVRLCTDISQY